MARCRNLINFTVLFYLLITLSSIHAEEINTQKDEPSPFIKGAWTTVLLPDTQYYASNSNNIETLNNMMDWIVAEKEKRNIQMVVHLGDITDWNSQQEWKRIRSSYKKLDNALPYLLCVGNHDQGSYKKEAKINDFFKISDNPLNKDIFRGSFEPNKLQNTYYLVNHNGQKYLFLALEYAPRNSVIEWADKIIKKHKDYHVFITVHQYMTETSRLVSKDGRPEPHSKRGFGNDDAKIFSRLAKPNPNVEFIVCGHVYAVKKGTEGMSPKGYEGVLVREQDIATGHRSDTKDNGLTVHQMLFNAQWIPGGGDGWMLLLEFSPDNKEVRVKTFSPHLKLWRTGPEYEYSLKRFRSAKKNSGSQQADSLDKK